MLLNVPLFSLSIVRNWVLLVSNTNRLTGLTGKCSNASKAS